MAYNLQEVYLNHCLLWDQRGVDGIERAELLAGRLLRLCFEGVLEGEVVELEELAWS